MLERIDERKAKASAQQNTVETERQQKDKEKSPKTCDEAKAI